MLAVNRIGRGLQVRLSDPQTQASVYDVCKLVGGVIGLFLIFNLTQSMGSFRQAEVATSHEATDLLQLSHVLNAEPALADETQTALRAYMESLIHSEWQAMRAGRADPQTEARLTVLRQAVARLIAREDGPRRREVLRSFEDVEDDRASRLGAARSLPGGMWSMVVGLFALLAACLALLDGRGRPFQTFSLYVACLCLLAALLFLADGPYLGSFSVAADPIVHALTRLDQG